MALVLPNNSFSTSAPIAQTGGDLSKVTPGRKLPSRISIRLTLKKDGVVPMTGTSRSKPPKDAGVSPMIIGAMFLMVSICSRLMASSMVRSLGAMPAKSAGPPPPDVSFLPGRTIIKLVPKSLNSPVM